MRLFPQFLLCLFLLCALGRAENTTKTSFTEKLKRAEGECVEAILTRYREMRAWQRKMISERITWERAEATAAQRARMKASPERLLRYLAHENDKRIEFQRLFGERLSAAFNTALAEIDTAHVQVRADANRLLYRSGDEREVATGIFSQIVARWSGQLSSLSYQWRDEKERQEREFVSLEVITQKAEATSNPLVWGNQPLLLQVLLDRELVDGRLADRLADCMRTIGEGAQCPLVTASSSGALFYGNREVHLIFYVGYGGQSQPLAPDVQARVRDQWRRHVIDTQYSAQRLQRLEYLVKRSENEDTTLASDRSPQHSEPSAPNVQVDPASLKSPVIIEDKFGRDLRAVGLPLIDWDGYLANPALELFLRPAPHAQLPLQVWLKAEEPRLMFDTPSEAGASGPSKSKFRDSEGKEQMLFFTKSNTKIPVKLSIWPDRNSSDEFHWLQVTTQETVQLPSDTKGVGPSPTKLNRSWKFAVTVRDFDNTPPAAPQPIKQPQDPFPFLHQPENDPFLEQPFPFIPRQRLPEHPWPFTVTLDFSRDRSGFFSEPLNREVARQAADDWAYFFDDQEFPPVAVGEEVTRLQEQGGDELDKVPNYSLANRYPYKDFLVYIMGANTTKPDGYGGAYGSGAQAGLDSYGLRRSGQVLLEGAGGQPGFHADLKDENWHRFIYVDALPRDLYSFLLHELGHALFMHQTGPVPSVWNDRGSVKDLVIQEYQGEFPKLEGEHVASTADAVSRYCAFGAKNCPMPHRRWIITKLDLLMAQQAGLKLRWLRALWPLTLTDREHLADAVVGEKYADRFMTGGGVPPHYWELDAGTTLPRGLQLDSFSGELRGVADESGLFPIILKATDQVGTTRRKAFQLKVRTR